MAVCCASTGASAAPTRSKTSRAIKRRRAWLIVDFIDIKLTDDNKHAIVSQNISARLMFVTRSHFLLGSMHHRHGVAHRRVSPVVRGSSAGLLTVAIESNPLQLDPRYATDANSVRIGNLIYNSLLRADQKSQLQPELAENWRMVDEKTYLFELRKDARFHDGRPLTAADVKFTYESISDPNSRSPKRGLLKPLHAVKQIGPYQLEFQLDAVHAPFVEQFTLGIVPLGSSSREPSSLQPPPGSGPFMIQSIESGERVWLKANPNAWQGKPSLGGLIFKVVPDAMVRVLEFQKGAVDFMQNDLEPDMLPWLRQNTNADVDSALGTTYQYIGINFTHPILRYAKCAKRWPTRSIAIELFAICSKTLSRRQWLVGAPQLGL